MIPDWTKRWTVAEAHDILLVNTSYQVELPVDRVPADTRLAEVWNNLTTDCRLMLDVKHTEF